MFVKIRGLSSFMDISDESGIGVELTGYQYMSD